MGIKYKGVLCIIGGFLVHFSLGTIYTFGNMSPYIASYMKFKGQSEHIRNGDMVWIYACSFVFQGLTMVFGGIINKHIGSRLTVLIGCWTMSFSVMLTYFTIKQNLFLTIVTYGALLGSGIGIAYSVAIAAAMRWFPSRRGFVIGIVVGGFGLGSFVFNQVQTNYINPNNLSPNISIGIDKYFSDSVMLERVPSCFLLMGGIYAGIQLIGCSLLFTPSIFEVMGNTSTIQIMESETSFKNGDKPVNKKIMQPIPTTDNPKDLSVMKSIKKKDFWILWCTFMLTGTVNIYTTSLYKTFGQLFINDDLFLSIIGSIAAIFNAGGRIFWGQITDKYSYKIAMRLITVLTTTLIGTFYCCILIKNETAAKILYIFWVCALLSNICGIFSLMPAVSAKIFGFKNVATIYGILFTANAIASLLGALTTSIFISKIGYLGIFEIGAGMTLIAFILTFIHPRKNL